MKIIYVLILSVLSRIAMAQPSTLNPELKQLVQTGFSYFPPLQVAEQQTRASEIGVKLNQANRLPLINANAEYKYVYPISKINIAFPGAEASTFLFQPRNNLNTYLGLNYTLFDFGRVKANIQKAREEVQLAKYNVDLAKSQFAAEVAGIYYGIIYVRKAIAIQDTVINYLKENRKVTESKFRNGDALEIDLLNIQASIDNEENRKLDLKNMQEKNLSLLFYSTGKDSISGNGSFDFSFPQSNKTDLLQTSIQNHPDFKLAQSRITISETELKISKLGIRPMVMLLGTAGFKNGYLPNLYHVRFNYSAGGTFMLPVYDGGRLKQQALLIGNSLKVNRLSLTTLMNTYQKDIAMAMADVNSGQEQLRNVETQIRQAKASQALAASMYRNGVATYLDLNNANSNYQRALLSKAQYEYQLCKGYIELARLSGLKFWE